jgi:hypothetical protein
MRAALLALVVLAAGCNQILGVEDVSVADDDDVVAIDAAPNDGIIVPPIDATVPDAPVNSGGLGRVCTMATDCDPGAPDCVQLGAAAPMWCTLTCGQTTDMSPPVGADAICAGQYQGGTGSPVCALYVPNGAMYDWYCVIACPNGLTDCPAGLSCGATSQACGGD